LKKKEREVNIEDKKAHKRASNDYLPETHFIGENAILAFAPKVCKPVETCKLKVLELSSSRRDVIWILGDLLEYRSLVAHVADALVRKLGFRLSLPVGFDLILGDGTHFVLVFPGAVIVVEAHPFAEILCGVCDWIFSMRYYPLDGFESLEIFLLTFLVKEERFVVFAGKSGSIELRLPGFVGLDVIVDTFETSESLEELIRLVRIVQVGEVLPFDVEALRRSKLRERGRIRRPKGHTMLSNQRSSESFSRPSSLV
jgi:hypothetical protein